MRILIVGAGQMGSGIAQVCAAAGHDVLLNDVDAAAIARGIGSIARNLSRGVEKGRLQPQEAENVSKRITSQPAMDAAQVDFAIEAATENKALKLEIFQRLDRVTPAGAIIASNTSSISITELAAVTGRAGQVIGMHFMNPVPDR